MKIIMLIFYVNQANAEITISNITEATEKVGINSLSSISFIQYNKSQTPHNKQEATGKSLHDILTVNSVR